MLGKFLSFGSKPNAENFKELPDCLVWMRFVLAISYGVFYLGASSVENKQGATPLLMALNFVSFGPMIYCMLILQADNESYGGKLFFAGLPNAMALVLLIWIYYYTLNHEEEEQKLAGLLSDLASKAAASVEDALGGEGGEGGNDAYVPPVDEPEF